MSEFNGTIELISGIKPKNNGNFPLIRAQDVLMPDGTRLSEWTGTTAASYDGSVRVVGSISFTITCDGEDFEYIAESGMTWGEFVASDYNIDNAFSEESDFEYNGRTIYNEKGETISNSTEIITGHKYYC